MKQLQLVLILVIVITPLFILLEPLELAQAEHSITRTRTTTTPLIPTIMTISSVSNNFNNSSNIQTIQNTTVNYYDNASGYLVYPILNPNNNTQKLPAVIMIDENRGLNDNIKDTADILAKQGYVVLAVDLFQGQVTADPNRARELSSSVRNNPDIAIENMQSAVRYLTSLENVNGSRIASLGWCFGGAQSLQLALNSEEHSLAATVIYYGNLVNDTQALSKIKWPVLGIFGDQDQSIPVDSVKQFEQALNEIGVINEIYIYPGVGHAFANPSGDNYAPKETANAWKKTLAFLNKYTYTLQNHDK
jgi:carboxymethylenebutenolidase